MTAILFVSVIACGILIVPTNSDLSVEAFGVFPNPTLAQQSGVYTDAQAARGRILYDQKCAACHGSKLDGTSSVPLAGSGFMKKWGQGDRSVDDLYYITRTQMPFGAGNTLSQKQYIDIVAYVLKVNGYAAGKRELAANSSALKAIKIVPPGGVKEQPAETKGGTDLKTAAPAGAPVPPSSSLPTQKELNAAHANTTDWLHSNHDYAGQRYVDLKLINQQNVASLKQVATYKVGDTKAFQTNPVVYRGVMFITTTWSTIAIDATNGNQVWRNDWKPRFSEIWPANRGVAIKDGRVVRATTDGYLYALDIQTGNLLWEKKLVAAEKLAGTFNIAPVIFEDLVIIGLGISELGVKGWIGAYKLDNGEAVWRFNTVPDDNEPGAETWGKPESKLRGGGAVWAPIALDHEKGLLYVPVANPAPDFLASVRPGTNLYTCSMIVLDVRTGKLKWYYQLVPYDQHDWDATQASPLFTAKIGGKSRNLVATAGKDGLLHVLDRDTKEHLYETPVTTRQNTETPLTTEGVHACPGVLGGVQWNGPAFNPRTNMLYVPSVDWCGTYKKADEARNIPGQVFMGGTYNEDPPDTARGWLTAIDASTGKVSWQYQSKKPMLAAVTTTSSDLVFAGELTGDLLALDARTGKVLYRANVGGPMNGGLVTYAIKGKQYVAAVMGAASAFWRAGPGSSTIVIFALP
ncbi:MAG TPA: PQQ-binding-like beta-propeller repeat protein [Blastocatellia bacterium]|nr:PQQ-binding-like beta-propeller repeat protein [Blastocatellia bacterium]